MFNQQQFYRQLYTRYNNNILGSLDTGDKRKGLFISRLHCSYKKAMTTMLEFPKTIIESIRKHQQLGQYDQAAALLFNNIDAFFASKSWTSTHQLLLEFPPKYLTQDPRLQYIKGYVFAREGRLEEAVSLLYTAKISSHTPHSVLAIQSSLELGYTYLRKEDFQTAVYHLQEADDLLQNSDNEQLHAKLLLRLAELYPDIGELSKSVTCAEQAYEQFRKANEIDGQFESLWLAALGFRQLGKYHQAAARLEMAKVLHLAGNLSPQKQVKVLNAQAHLSWYRGNLSEAVAQTIELKQFADEHIEGKQRIYARALLANLYRDMGEIEKAQQQYDDVRRLVKKLKHYDYVPWVDSFESWLNVLMGNLTQAQALIYGSLGETTDHGRLMSFNVVLAVINILSEQFQPAEELLLKSSSFYQESGSELAVHTIQLYLAFISMQTDHDTQATDYLNNALAWFSDKNLDYFPLWWHPGIVNEVCRYALVKNIYPNLIMRVLKRRLGNQGEELLRTLLDHEDTAVRNRVAVALGLTGQALYNELDDVDAGPAKDALEDLLLSGYLNASGFQRFKKWFYTAQKRKSFNPALAATFSFYLQNYTRREIAEKLQLSEHTIKKHVTIIYQIFKVPENLIGTQNRKAYLHAKAVKEGFIVEE